MRVEPTDRYARYTRLTFDRPHPRVLRITMDNGKMNAADRAMHTELAEIWRDVDADPTVNAAIITGAVKTFSAGGDFTMIEEMVADYGKTTTLPNLWIYALNDQYWGPTVPQRWHDAFARGGSPSTFVHEPAVPDGDGHGLSRHDASLWAPAVDTFLAKLPFLQAH